MFSQVKTTGGSKGDRLTPYLVALILATCLEGAFRKWFLPQALHGVAYLAKDLVAFVIVIQFPLPSRAIILSRFRDTIALSSILLLPAIYWGLGLVPEIALVTAKNAVLWPIAAVHIAGALTTATRTTLEKTLLIVGVAVAALSLTQFSSAPDSELNRYVAAGSGSASIAGFGDGNVRATDELSRFRFCARTSSALGKIDCIPSICW